jgi:hypothetical protein
MRPGWGAPQALSFVRNFLGFETDSSRSYAKLVCFVFSGLFLADAED